MRSFVQVLTTPTADTPGTTLLLHFDNKRYLIGSLAEGTQRASVQMGARLLKVSELFVTGRTEWSNTGGMIGMILTLADSNASSQASSQEDAMNKAMSKARRLGIENDEEKMRQLDEQVKKESLNILNIFGPRNLNHTLATARRYVFRKGMPVDIHEIRGDLISHKAGDDKWAPYWADENIKVWPMSVPPSSKTGLTPPPSINPRKRSIDEVYAEEKGKKSPVADDLTPEDRDYLTAKAVVSEMFNSTWRLDTLYEMPLNEVVLPATVFVRNPDTKKMERYKGPLPGGNEPVPDPTLKVFVRRPWPGALVESLPPPQSGKEAVSYIIRNHMQRGKFHPERAKQLKVKKGQDYSALTKGQSVQSEDGKTITPEMVLDPSRVGGGIAVVDLPSPAYIDNLIAQPEWREPAVMEGVGAVMWICGKDVAIDSRLHSFMEEFSHLEHVVSSPDYCPNNIALDSAAASTIRLRQIDPERYGVPVHDVESEDEPQAYGGNSDFMSARRKHPLPAKAHIAVRGQTIQLEPAIGFRTEGSVAPLNIREAAAEIPPGVVKEAAKAQGAVKAPDSEMEAWRKSLPPGAQDAEIITLGTGSALPSKYRNVSATLVRVPDWGNLLLDCGENTLGQLKRVFTAEDLKQVLRDLRIIVISHMHADHQLGTTSVIRAWYQEVHNGELAPPVDKVDGNIDFEAVFKSNDRLAVISEPAMQDWLKEYSAVEDYGYSRLAPLSLSAKSFGGTYFGSNLSWYIPPAELKDLTSHELNDLVQRRKVPKSLLNLEDIQAVSVNHCHGARATSVTLPSGFKVSYSGDCRPSKQFAIIGKNSTVCIHEATFDDEMVGDAMAKKHSTTSEALGIAQEMRAKACVLTHFSQRYQKLPVLEYVEGELDNSKPDDVEMALEAAEDEADADGLGGPLEDAPATVPDEPTTNAAPKYQPFGANATSSGQASSTAASEPVKFKLKSDLKVCVAFDYMRVKVGDIGHMEKFTPALLKLFAEEDKQDSETVDIESINRGGKGKSKKNKNKGGSG